MLLADDDGFETDVAASTVKVVPDVTGGEERLVVC